MICEDFKLVNVQEGNNPKSTKKRVHCLLRMVCSSEIAMERKMLCETTAENDEILHNIQL